MKIQSLLIVALVTLFFSCEKEVTFNVPQADPKLVVEGWIDVGQPPIVILTRSSNYYGNVDLNAIQGMFVHDAVIHISDGEDTVTLSEFSLDTAGVLVSVYTNFSMLGVANKTYRLWVTAGDQSVSAVTTIPPAYPLDSVWTVKGKQDDSTYARLMVRYSDPPEVGQFVRYFTKANHEVMKPGRASVFEDKLINGTTFDFSLDKGYLQQDSINFEAYGLFKKGDTITVRWANIDKDHFDFWRTLEFELNQGGPYASPVKVQGNIVGGLGIWGGYNSSYDTIIANF